MPVAIHVCLPSTHVYARRAVSSHKRTSSENPTAFTLCDSQGFDGDRQTIHLGRTEPGEYIVQVTEDAINVVQQAGWGVFELAASWRPPPLPSPPISSFKVQHAGNAGTIVAVVCESTMFLVEVRGVAANQATRGRIDGENPASLATGAKVKAKEVLRAELSGGPVSALGMRLLGSNGDAEGSVECE